MNENSSCKKNTKRKILVVEDNFLNLELLTCILEGEYDVITAENGRIGLELLSRYYRELSLVILDVYMPVCNGFQFLEEIKNDALLSSVPVIVATGSNKSEDEIKCLKLGASDFITKPYNTEVVLGRVHSIIKLKESVATLSVVEYDQITQLYTFPAFSHHAENLLKVEADRVYHLLAIDIHGFKLINSIHGKKKGDDILFNLGRQLRERFPEAILSRQSDKFYILIREDYCPSMEKLQLIIEEMVKNSPLISMALKCGIYYDIDKEMSISTVCDRAIMALNSIKHDFTKNITPYNEEINNQLIHEQQMEFNFEKALQNGEFVPWFQPKIDARTEEIIGAEALVRWISDDGNIISPGFFIPLFEKDGLIGKLDEYIHHRVCQFQKKRMEEGKRIVPISVNLSRNSIYQNDTIRKYKHNVEEYEIPHKLVPIELTESAASEGRVVLELVSELNHNGFSLHMDDFGSGYSSISSLTTMPLDVIKFDKSLIDNIGNSKGNTVIHHLICIAQEFGMKTVAEGVETKEQVDFLKKIGCDMIQGYYFSPPVNEESFERMLEENCHNIQK